MHDFHADALVFFGATGDLAYKKIFRPAGDGQAWTPACAGYWRGRSWVESRPAPRGRMIALSNTADQSCRVRTTVGLLRYVDGDYQDPTTFQSLRQELGSAQRPAHYLAIPPGLFGMVVEQLGKAECTHGARVIVEKPFGHDLLSAQALNRTLLGTFDEQAIFRIDHYLGKLPVHNMLFFRFANAFLERSGIAIMSRACRSPWPKTSASRGGALFMIKRARSATSSKTICSRSWPT